MPLSCSQTTNTTTTILPVITELPQNSSELFSILRNYYCRVNVCKMPHHKPILYGSNHKSETTLGWMLQHMDDTEEVLHASPSWLRCQKELNSDCCKCFTLNFFHCPANRHPMPAALGKLCTVSGCWGICWADCSPTSQAIPVFRSKNETPFSANDIQHAKVNMHLRSSIFTFKSNTPYS